MKSIYVLVLFALVVPGQSFVDFEAIFNGTSELTPMIINATYSSSDKTWALYDKLVSYINEEIKPEVNKFISHGKEYIQKLGMEKKGREIFKTAIEMMNSTSELVNELELAEYIKIFEDKLEDGKKMAKEISKQIDEFLKKLQKKAKEMKGKIPETLLSLTKLNEEIKKRVTSLQSKMEELQKKAKKAFEAGQENVLKNIEQQLEMIRTQLKVAKQQTLELKKKIQETFSDIQLKAKKVGGEAMKHVTLLRKKTEEAVEKAKRHYTIMKNNLTKNFQNAMMKFRQAKREAQDQLEKLQKIAKEIKTGMGEQMEEYIETLNTTVNDMKDNFFEQMKTLKEISANYTDILKDKLNDYKTTANNLTTKMKENMDEFHANVMKHMQSMKKKADQHVKKMFEKAKDLKTTLKTRAQKTATEMQKNLDALMKQYKIALATAMGMQKDAEENLRKVMERMSNGSQVIFQKAYEIAVKNVENSKKYMNEVQSYFVKLLSKLLFKETGGHLTKITPQIQSLKKKKLAYLRMRKKLRSFFSSSGGI